MKLEKLAIMKLFKAYLSDSEKNFEISKLALEKGIYIDKNCPEEILNLACDIWGKDGFLLNQTFHKSFQKVVDTKEENLILEQLLHYMTTYGLESIGEYNQNLVYIPKEKLEIPEIKEDIKLIKISKITKEELKEKLWSLSKSSIALSKDTIQDIFTLKKYLEITKDNINDIKNNELKIMFCDELNLVPKDPVEFLRYFIYKLTGNTLLIKDKKTVDMLKTCDRKLCLQLLKKYNNLYGLEGLAQIYNRYKVIFVSLKTGKRFQITEEYFEKRKSKSCQKYEDIFRKWDIEDFEKEVNTIINKISHLSKKYHKPYIKSDLDQFAKWCQENENSNTFQKDLEKKLETSPIWRIIQLKNYLAYKRKDIDNHCYKIRNGKVWIDTCSLTNHYDSEIANLVLDSIIVDKLSKKVENKKIYLEENVDLVLPQSEKKFLGNIPFGSSISLEKENLIVGIHWYNLESQRVDLDLKIFSNEYFIGWDTSDKEDDRLIFSGDVTDAPYPNGASEYIYIDKRIGRTIFSLKVNNYTRNKEDIYYDIIIAKGKRENIANNYIVDPNDILIKIPNNIIEVGSAEHSLGTIAVSDNKIELFFTDIVTGNRRVSMQSDLEDTFNKIQIVESKCKCKLKDYLQKAGAIIITDSNQKDTVDYDFSIESLKKNSFIDIFI